MKLISTEKNTFKIISSDEEGQVMLSVKTPSKIKTKLQNYLILKNNFPIYSIIKFNPSENDTNKLLIGFAFINKVFLYSLEQQQKKKKFLN